MRVSSFLCCCSCTEKTQVYQRLSFNCYENKIKFGEVRPEGCPSCASVLQALIFSGKSRLSSSFPCSSERGIFLVFRGFTVFCQQSCLKLRCCYTAKVSDCKGYGRIVLVNKHVNSCCCTCRIDLLTDFVHGSQGHVYTCPSSC